MSRFAEFTDQELALLWDGLTMDDGLRYGMRPTGPAAAPEYGLAAEIHAEAASRGLVAANEYRWEHVL